MESFVTVLFYLVFEYSVPFHVGYQVLSINEEKAVGFLAIP
jgi:hypothetical protein